MNRIADSLRQFIEENFLYGGDATFSDDDSFLELGLIDSTGVLELVTFIEDKAAGAVRCRFYFGSPTGFRRRRARQEPRSCLTVRCRLRSNTR